MREESKSVLKCFSEISYQGEQSNDCLQLSDAPRWKLFLIFSPRWVVGLLCACQYIFVIFLSVFSVAMVPYCSIKTKGRLLKNISWNHHNGMIDLGLRM